VDEAKPFKQRPNIGSRVTREGHARFWERPEVKFLRATRQPEKTRYDHGTAGKPPTAEIFTDGLAQPATDIRATWDTPLTPVLRAMDTRAARPILPTPVPVTDIPCLVVPPIALRRTGLLTPNMGSSLLAKFQPENSPQSLIGAYHWTGECEGSRQA
jgi:hypothetical protein